MHFDRQLAQRLLPLLDLTSLGEDDTPERVAAAAGFTGRIVTDPGKPDGTPRKLMDVSRLKAMGWEPKIGLREGIERTLREYRAQLEAAA